MPEKLEGLSQDIAANTKKPKRKRTTTQKKSPTMKGKQNSKKKKKKSTSPERKSERIPKGFSLRANSQRAGPRPVCQGCFRYIQYRDACVRYKYMEKRGHKFMKTVQYHCTARCVNLMDPEHKVEFFEKKWTEKTVLNILKEFGR